MFMYKSQTFVFCFFAALDDVPFVISEKFSQKIPKEVKK